MVSITETAAEKAKEILKAEGKAEWGLRVFMAGSGCCGPSYGMDIDEKPKDGDEVIEKDGLKVFVDQSTLQSLGETVIDFIQDEQGEGFIMKRTDEGGAPSCDCSSGCG